MQSPLRTCILVFATLLLAPAAVLGLQPSKSIFQFNCKNWTRLAGLPADKISAIAQDSRGFIWFGTQSGLVKFDGQAFTVVPVTLPSARGTHISSLTKSRAGTLWFSIKDGGFGGFDGQQFVPLGDDRWSENSDASSLIVGRDGVSLFSGTVTGWGRWTPGAREHVEKLQDPQSVISMYEESSGRVWLGTSLAGLSYWESGVVSFFPDNRLRSTNVQAVIRDQDNHLWVGTSIGLFRYDASLRPVGVYLPDVPVSSLLIDRHGVLWIGTGGSGLHRYSKGMFSQLTKADGLGSDNVTCLFEDEESSLWIGTTEGVSQMTDVKFPIYSGHEGVTDGSATSVAASPGGGLWIGTNSGATYLKGEEMVKVTDRAILKNPYVRRVFVARNGDVFLGDGSRNLVVLRNNEVIARFSNELWPEAFLDGDNGDVIAGIGRNLVRIHDGQMTPYEFEGPAPDLNWVNNLARSADGAVWAATNRGLFRIQGKTFQQWTQEDGLPSARIHCVVADVGGGVWCGSANGLLHLKDGRLTHFGIRSGLADARIFAIVPDLHGSMWLSTSRGVLRVSRANLLDFVAGKVERIDCSAFDGLESLKVVDRTDQGFSGALSTDGRVWFPTPRGVLMIDPRAHFTNTVPPRIQLDRVQVEGRDLPLGDSATLTSGNHAIQFFFTALSYAAPDKIQVRYRLKNFDVDWIDGTSRRSVTYQELPAGEYVFQIKAANADGVWSSENVEFAITVPSPLYTRAWFIGLCGIAGGVMLYGGYQLKVRRFERLQQLLQQQNETLERNVSERTEELAKSLALLRATLDSTADGILAIRPTGEVISHNAQFDDMWRLPAHLRSTTNGVELQLHLSTQVKEPEAFMARLSELSQTLVAETFDVLELSDGRVFERYCRPQLVKTTRVGIVMNYRDVTQRKHAEERLAQAHRQLLETSRQAGMAEVATSVLHNVGNVLNSVNVSATLAIDQLRDLKVSHVAKVADLLTTNAADLAGFLATDDKGKKLIPYLTALGENLTSDREQISGDLMQLRKNVDHIKEIVSMHQGLGQVAGVNETVSAQDLFEDARLMHSACSTETPIEIVCNFTAAPVLTVDRHKVLQILINLIRNAYQSCTASSKDDARITLSITSEQERVRFNVADNGVGIPRENLIRIFSHGFTTKKNGHGFGLHSAALTAKELGGSLQATSEGPGQGATFVLDLPLSRDPQVTDNARSIDAGLRDELEAVSSETS